MAVDKLVDSTQLDTDLTAVANAIRTKGGTSAQLAFPAGFVSAIDAIPTGGGGGGLSLLASGTYTLTTQGTTVSIPVSFSGTPINVFVVFRGTYSGIQHTHAWAFIATLPTDELSGLFPAASDKAPKGAIGMLANGNTVYQSPIRARLENNSTIDVRQTGSSYPCLAGQYEWYIYGEAAT